MTLKDNKTPTNGALRVWWVPQIPMKHFERDVRDLEQAKFLLETLADYDLFQFENRVKGDYCNTGGLVIFEYGEWLDWYDPDTDDDFDTWMAARQTEGG